MYDEIKKHEKLKQVALYCYDIKKNNPPKGYQLLGIGMMDNGFYACVLKKENNIIIAHRGTEKTDLNDYKNDFQMLRKKIPQQIKSALQLYDNIHKDYINCNIILTGHSLGGSLAQLVGAIRDVETVTFNAYGTKDLLPENVVRVFSNKIVNYCNPKDIITTWNGKSHIGTCYLVYSNNNTEFPVHSLERMKHLNSRLLISKEHLNFYGKELMQIKEEKDYYYKSGKHMPISMPSINCVGSYFVNGYTKKDGTNVESYIRTCGAKHNK